MAVSDWNTTPALNTSISGINIAEGCAPGNLNDAIRQMMADVKTSVATDIPAAYQAKDADLTAIAGLSSNGIVTRTGAGTAAARTITEGAGITVTNGNGVSGNPTIAVTNGTEGQILRSGASTPAMGAQIVLGTAVASTSGSSIDFTGIPAWARRINLLFQGVSTNGSNTPIVQIGDAGGLRILDILDQQHLLVRLP